MSKTRPLGTLSDFVVEELPQLLVEDPAVIPQKVEVFLRKLVDNNQIHKAYFENRELCLLDLKFCEVAMIISKLEVPLILTNAVDFFCSGINIPGLQYHELVRVNPIADMRAYSTGEIRETEIMFYNAHRTVEDRLSFLVSSVDDFLADKQNNRQLLSGYHEMMDFNPIRERFIKLHGMTEGHFPFFRQFISKPCPVRQVDGPSGAYSWRIPYLELSFWGSKLPESYLQEMKEKGKYYSANGRGAIERKLSQINISDTLSGLSDDDDLGLLVPLIYNWMAFMTTFRKMHEHAVIKQIPDVAQNKAPGTSGNLKAGDYLANRIDEMQKLYVDYKATHQLGG